LDCQASNAGVEAVRGSDSGETVMLVEVDSVTVNRVNNDQTSAGESRGRDDVA